MAGQAQQFAAFVQQAVVHTPSVKAQAVGAVNLRERRVYFLTNGREVVAHTAVVIYRDIVKSVDFLIFQSAVLISTGNSTPAGRAEVKGNYGLFHACTTPFCSRMLA